MPEQQGVGTTKVRLERQPCIIVIVIVPRVSVRTKGVEKGWRGVGGARVESGAAFAELQQRPGIRHPRFLHESFPIRAAAI